MNRTILMSIKPEFAKKIFTREKKYELRRQKPRSSKATTVIVYVTAPIKCLIGHFKTGQIIEDKIFRLWESHNKDLGISYESYNSYFNGKEQGFAIEILNPILWENSISLEQIRHNIKHYNPPQSYAYLPEAHAIKKLIEKMIPEFK